MADREGSARVGKAMRAGGDSGVERGRGGCLGRGAVCREDSRRQASQLESALRETEAALCAVHGIS